MRRATPWVILAALLACFLATLGQTAEIRWGRSNTIYGDNTFAGDLTVNGAVSVAGAVTNTGTHTWTLGASEYLQLDADTTDSTTTGGVLDINWGSATSLSEAVNIDMNIGDEAAGGIYSGILVDIDDDSPTASDSIMGLFVNVSDTTGHANTGIWGVDVEGADIALRTILPAEGQALSVDATTTDNAGLAGILDINADSVTNGFEIGNFDLNVGDAGAGVTVTGLLLDLDDDTNSNAATIDGVHVNASDITGHATTAVTAFKSSGADVGVSATVPAAGRGLVIDAAATDNTGATGAVLDAEWDSNTASSEAINVKATHLTGGTGQTISAIEVELDSDSGNASDMLQGVYVNTTDATATGKVDAIVVNGAGTNAALQANHGYVRVGTGSTPDVTPGDDDVFVEGTIEVDGATRLDGTAALNGAVTVGQVDVTISPVTNGGNAGVKNEYIGLPRIKLVGGGSGTNGAAAGKTIALMDDTPTGEFAAHDADTTATADATYYKEGAASLGILFSAAADAGDGAHDGVAVDFTDDESVGFYMYCDQTWVSGDLAVDLTDDGGARVLNLPAYSTANTWQWIDLTTGVTALANAEKDVISDISFELTAQGAAVVATRATQCYFDGAFKWDSTEEEALSTAVLRDGVLSVVNTESGASLAEWTDYFVHEESGNDFIVYITDQSTADVIALVAY